MVTDKTIFRNQDNRSELQAMAEDDLSAWAQQQRLEEAYRFIYLPTFDPPETIRVWKVDSVGPELQAVFKQGSAQGGEQPGEVEKEVNWQPTQPDWIELLASIEQNFWEPPAWKGEVNHDGSEWIFEGYRQGHYKRLKSWSGRDPYACALGQSFRKFISDELSDEEDFVFFRGVRGDRLGQIIYGYLEAGQCVKALQLAQTHKSDYIKTWALEDMVFESWAEFRREAKLAILVQATETASAIKSSLRKAPILRTIALKYVGVEQLNRALQVAQSIENPYYQVITLDYLCNQFAEQGKTETSDRIRTQILQVARRVQDNAQTYHLAGIVSKHTKLERLDRKLSRLLTSWLSVKSPQ